MSDTIFVSIASYRDPDCKNTVKDLFDKARYPYNVFVGICQQNSNEDEDALILVDDKYKKNIRIIRISHLEAGGPTKARYLCSSLVNNERYFFQIDSHTRFVKDWDVKLIDMEKSVKSTGLSDKPVISHYPLGIEQADNKKTSTSTTLSVPTICKSFFHDSNGILSFEGAKLLPANGKVRRGAYVAGGMFFCMTTFLKEIPFDPNLDFLFIGEEILHSARFYTHGWDVFTPSENIVFHEYTRSEKPKIWVDKQYSAKDSELKVKTYLDLEDGKDRLPEYIKQNLELYGLGNKRSLDEYYSFIGLDKSTRTINKDFCNEIEHFNSSDKRVSITSVVLKIMLLLAFLLVLYKLWTM